MFDDSHMRTLLPPDVGWFGSSTAWQQEGSVLDSLFQYQLKGEPVELTAEEHVLKLTWYGVRYEYDVKEVDCRHCVSR